MGTQQNETRQQKAKLGRPEGSTVLTKEQFWKYSVEAYRYHSITRTKRPTQDAIASRIGVARATFNNYQKRFGITWSQIRASGGQQLLDYECSGKPIPEESYSLNWT